ncbi:MAG TPA: nucleotide sugar dehydrogenase [Methanobacterium sp.]|nr:nucleotide sugar dehydrogenase [Methanobacterium sp.]HPX77622.1 nucleotide sugar dehydrogenase [Methanobacterium sp.]
MPKLYQKLLKKIKNKELTICVVGLGYVGLPTAIFFAENDFNVIGVGTDEIKLDMIGQGISPLGELGLDSRLLKVVQDKKLVTTPDLTEATRQSDIILIIVPTPVTKSKDPDLSHIISAGENISKGMEPGKLVVLESTVYPGVTEETLQPILESSGLKAGEDFGLAYCPERYNPGDDAHSIEKVARVVGGITPEWADITRELYQFIIEEDIQVLRNIKTAEAAKVIENTQRDLNIALVNELAMIFEKLGIDVMEVIKGASSKWNFNEYYPGGGVGGHCLPVDPYYLVKKAKELGYQSKVIAAGRTINDYMPKHVFGLITDALNDNERSVKNSKIVVLGLSYKENVGDDRESPSVQLIGELERNQALITIVDPYIQETAIYGTLEETELYGKVESDVYNALDGAHALVLMTAHDEFRELDFEKIKKLMKLPIIIDGRRIFNPKDLEDMGFYYRGIGRGNLE